MVTGVPFGDELWWGGWKAYCWTHTPTKTPHPRCCPEREETFFKFFYLFKIQVRLLFGSSNVGSLKKCLDTFCFSLLPISRMPFSHLNSCIPLHRAEYVQNKQRSKWKPAFFFFADCTSLCGASWVMVIFKKYFFRNNCHQPDGEYQWCTQRLFFFLRNDMRLYKVTKCTCLVCVCGLQKNPHTFSRNPSFKRNSVCSAYSLLIPAIFQPTFLGNLGKVSGIF
jgi:hypothetical protein